MKKQPLFILLVLVGLSSCKKEVGAGNHAEPEKRVISHLHNNAPADRDASITLMSSRGYSFIDGQTAGDTYLECILKPSDSLQTFNWNGVPAERKEGWNFYRRFFGESTVNVVGVSGNFVGAGGNFPSFSIPFQAPKQMEITMSGVNATNQATIPVNGAVTISWIRDLTPTDRQIVIMGINDESIRYPRQVQKIISEDAGSVTFTSGDLQTLGGAGAVVYFVVSRGNEATEIVGGKKVYMLAVSYAWTGMATIE